MRDPVDFDAFYAATSQKLVGQVFAMTGDLGEAEDALQEAYVRAWQHWPKVSGYESPEGWVRSVAFKLCVNAWWKAKNRLTAHRRAAAGREPAPGLEPDLLTLVHALRQLPDKQRHALVLHYIADLSVEQIATETGASPGTVKSRLARGRRALAPLVSEFCDDEPQAAAVRQAVAAEAPYQPGRVGKGKVNHAPRKDYDYA